MVNVMSRVERMLVPIDFSRYTEAVLVAAPPQGAGGFDDAGEHGRAGLRPGRERGREQGRRGRAWP